MLKQKNSFLFLGSLFFALLFGSILFYDIPIWKIFLLKDFSSIDLEVLKNNSKKTMGTIIEVNGQDFQVKSIDKEDFLKSNHNDMIFNQDTLWTGNNTTAIVKLNDGGELKLEPNTMVQLDLTKYDPETGIAKIPEIKIFTGAIEGAAKTQINIKDEKNGQVKLVASNQKIPSIKIVNRSINRNIASTTINQEPTKEKIQEELIKVDEVKTPEITQPINVEPKILKKIEEKHFQKEITKELRPISNVKSSIMNVSSNSNKIEDKEIKKFEINLNWEEIINANKYEVNILDNIKLNPVAKYQTTENKIKINNLLFNGKLKYKVMAFKNNDKIGESKIEEIKFSYNPPELKSPKNGIQLFNDNAQYFFTWEKTNFTEKYIFEIANNNKFEKSIKKELSSNFITIKLLSGQYFWRVKSVNEYLNSEFSSVNSIMISDK